MNTARTSSSTERPVRDRALGSDASASGTGARPRGIRPLFYAQTRDRLLCLRRCGRRSATVFEGVLALPPGHVLVAENGRSGRGATKRSFPSAASEKSAEEYAEVTHRLSMRCVCRPVRRCTYCCASILAVKNSDVPPFSIRQRKQLLNSTTLPLYHMQIRGVLTRAGARRGLQGGAHREAEPGVRRHDRLRAKIRRFWARSRIQNTPTCPSGSIPITLPASGRAFTEILQSGYGAQGPGVFDISRDGRPRVVSPSFS